ncbi:MAG: recombinase family protein [Oscillospiraceae bacterium]|jgi:DNA invertase Pin-like site-specific DNA recombinase|nr:recombinase family protein [Oscillospiraceae bacterium]
MQTGTNYGYVRVSTKKQNEDRQLIALAEYGILPHNIFIDKKSGKDFERQKYRRLIKKLKQGDVIFVESIDRFGRNYEEIIEQWRFITKKKGADVVVLDMPLLDTRQKDLDLTGTFIADLVLQILSYVAEKEKEYNHQRQAEGIAAAKAKGVKFGRPAHEKPEQFATLYETWTQGEISGRAAARELGIAQRTFILWASERSAIVTE